MKATLVRDNDGRYYMEGISMGNYYMIDFLDLAKFYNENAPLVLAAQRDEWWTKTYNVDMGALRKGDVVVVEGQDEDGGETKLEVDDWKSTVVDGVTFFTVRFTERVRPVAHMDGGIRQFDSDFEFIYNRNGRIKRDFAADINIDVVRVIKRE